MDNNSSPASHQSKAPPSNKFSAQPKPVAPAQLSPHAKPPAWLKISMASIGGFSSAFVALVAVVLIRPGTQQAGQLVAGDVGANSDLPTTLNIARDTMSGGSSLLIAMSSYFFWVLLIILGLVFTSMFFRMARERI